MNEWRGQLRWLIDRYPGTHADLARKIGRSPEWLSRVLTGKQPGVPSREILLRIGDVLALSEDEMNGLLGKVGHTPLSSTDQVQRLHDLAAGIRDPERSLIQERLNADLQAFGNGWKRYATLRQRMYERDWGGIRRDVQHATEAAASLERGALRLRAWATAAEASALQHLNQVTDAADRCASALGFAERAHDQAAQVQLLIRMGDIHRLQGRYAAAEEKYLEAERALSRLQLEAPNSGAVRSFMAVWIAALGRKKGTLRLFRGEPVEALALIQGALRDSRDADARYEEIRCLFAEGWALNLLGRRGEALRAHLAGQHLVEELAAETGKRDPRSDLQAALYLGGDYLDGEEYDEARENLDQALDLVRKHPQLSHYHEVGRVYLLSGRVRALDGAPSDEPERYLRDGLDFYRLSDPMRTASAYNMLGELKERQRNYKEAILQYRLALASAEESDPPQAYYATAARINLARALLLEATGPAETIPEEVDMLLHAADEVSTRNGYVAHAARLHVLRARLRKVPKDSDRELEIAFAKAKSLTAFGETWLLKETFEDVRRFIEDGLIANTEVSKKLLSEAEKLIPSPHERRRRRSA